jgi:hypothetical protein
MTANRRDEQGDWSTGILADAAAKASASVHQKVLDDYVARLRRESRPEAPGLARNRRARERWAGMTREERTFQRAMRRRGYQPSMWRPSLDNATGAELDAWGDLLGVRRAP